MITMIFEVFRDSESDLKIFLLPEYKKGLEGKIKQVCDEVQEILIQLIKGAKVEADKSAYDRETAEKLEESHVFFLKMQGDYYRYEAEIEEKINGPVADKALNSYNSAIDAGPTLKPTHPMRLGLALNFLTFYYEIMNNPEKVCELAINAFNGAIAELDTLNEDSYKDSTLIMQLIRDNITLWNCD